MLNFILCAWCGGEMERKPGVDPASHGICSRCAAEWQSPADYRDSYRLEKRAALDAEIAAFQRWQWSIGKARKVAA